MNPTYKKIMLNKNHFFILCFLLFSISTYCSNDSFNLYQESGDNEQPQEQTGLISSQESSLTTDDELNFFENEDPVVKAPPGGGPPIGGVPVKDGYWIVFALAGIYLFSKGFKSTKMNS